MLAILFKPKIKRRYNPTLSLSFAHLKWGVVDEFCLLDDVEGQIDAVFGLRDATPVEEVVVVHNARREVGLTQDGRVFAVVLVREGTDKAGKDQ